AGGWGGAASGGAGSPPGRSWGAPPRGGSRRPRRRWKPPRREGSTEMKVGVLTAGGDCPGLNAAIRGVVARVTGGGGECVGIQKGWRGLMEGLVRPLTRDDVRGILYQGGTILGTSRMDPYVHGNGYESVRETVESAGIDSLVVIGGDGSLRTAARLEAEGLPVVGVPKTIDNDISGTDV